MLEYNAAKDWLRVRGARSLTVRQGLSSPKREGDWLSLGQGGLKIAKALPFELR